jgi:hypothetical protein
LLIVVLPSLIDDTDGGFPSNIVVGNGLKSSLRSHKHCLGAIVYGSFENNFIHQGRPSPTFQEKDDQKNTNILQHKHFTTQHKQQR